MRESEARHLRSAAESSSTHEAETRSLREQHARELQCVREELQAERKRYLCMLAFVD
jgi:hypothetical protein